MRQLVRVKMLVGLGAALFLAGSIHAQQSVDPSSFSDLDSSTVQQAAIAEDSTAASIDQMDVLRIAQHTGSTMRAGLESLLLAAAYALSSPRTEESDLAGLKIVDKLLVLILAAGAGAIVRYAETGRYPT
jgi:hypothetical protein